jgi:hypothetical protein
MRRTMIWGPLIFLCLSSFGVGAQTTPASQPTDETGAIPLAHGERQSRPREDWNRVRDLTHDEQISVWASQNRHVRCLFTGATDDDLFCEPAYSRWHSSRGEYRFSRIDVDKVRLEQSERNFKTTVIATGVVGAIAGGVLTKTKFGGERVLGSIGGGLVGTMAGVIIGLPVAIFVPGQLVYQRPRAQRTVHAGPNNVVPPESQAEAH